MPFNDDEMLCGHLADLEKERARKLMDVSNYYCRRQASPTVIKRERWLTWLGWLAWSSSNMLWSINLHKIID